jgi:aryl-alcohol dehydrogenase-like predicted oxidoreductase
MVELGLGLLSIGRPWGVRQEPPPSETAALELLQKAVDLGIRFFDTAPAYGASEAILGRFLRSRAADVFVATKMGETWEGERSTVDHRFDALKRSIDRSLELLGRIDLLQVHKATAANLRSPDVGRAIEYARTRGIRAFGASVPDLAAAEAAAGTGWCSYLQFPFNRANTALAPIFTLARERGLKLLVNRPLAMGELSGSVADAFRFVRAQRFSGVVLTGTKSSAHLAQNHAAFQAAAA